MAKYLVIVESPAKVKTIKKFLGKNYEVMASNGHVRDLPKSQLGIDVEHDYEPKYITIRGKGEILAKLRKEAKKAEKEAKKAAKAEEKAAKKAEKEAKKAERRAQQEEEAEAEKYEVTGKLNKVGVAIIAILTVTFLVVEIVGTNIHGYSSSKKQAMKYFEMGKYEQAYQEVLGTKVKEKDPDTYNKIRTVMQVQRALDSYQNYDAMNYYPDALNALIRGLQRYDANLETAKQLEIGGRGRWLQRTDRISVTI